MYQRIMNKLDAELFSEELKEKNVDSMVVERMREMAGMLDDRYGVCRGSADMGGYILFFHDSRDYGKCISYILQFYHMDGKLFEYSERINENTASDVEWWEELYLLSSEDALVLIYPKGDTKKREDRKGWEEK